MKPVRVLCRVCGEPIGVYEPAVYLDGPFVKRTSRAAEPAVDDAPGYRPFHAVCFDAPEDVPPVPSA